MTIQPERTVIMLGRKQFHARFQPIVGLSQQYYGAELLSIVSGVDNVEDFFSIQSSRSVRDLVEQQLKLVSGKNERIFINIAHQNLIDDDFVNRLLSIRTPLALEIEHLASLSLEEHLRVRHNTGRLRDCGHQIWLDDVKRHTPLAALRYLYWDGIKIDKHYFWQMRGAFLQQAARFYRRYAQTILVEGIETEVQYLHCRQSGIDLGQGYYWHCYLP
ncbi:EAL domain-containing protein [Enterobacillus tribolii]|uniref:EAL domain-containing protein (Putative c-di-GMP-specific phosphodiesterase class I) n=1 Tax=Enterobacillus tribolii TaxID=1487935 RepID=A0A370QU87_9GAMM|nr:EAL domain-containing protein [Enterobacillus tribolii]MBW7981147.1 EAL domain-containing protein [Enterobacillus tribolii]RDK92795.1 EAL domain-containing protein (putative c-di-GMP-specific phosphodiesterase class I) [Enterobacillus tribolii]